MPTKKKKTMKKPTKKPAKNPSSLDFKMPSPTESELTTTASEASTPSVTSAQPGLSEVSKKDIDIARNHDFKNGTSSDSSIEPKKESEPDPSEKNDDESTKLHQERVAFYEKTFPLLFTDEWLSSSELHRFLEAERSFVPPPIPVVKDEDINIHGANNGKKKHNSIVIKRVDGAGEAHFELGKLGAYLYPRIPKHKQLIPVPPVVKLRSRMPGEDAAKFLEEHKHGYYTFIANFYLSKNWDWGAAGVTRYSFLTSPYKIARIIKHLKCTIEDYIEVFGLQYSDRGDYMRPGYMPFYLAARCCLIHPNPVYRRLWKATVGLEALECVNTPKIIQWDPAQVLNVWEPGRLKKNKNKYEEVVWRSVREYERKEFDLRAGQLTCYDSDAEFGLER